MWQTLRFLCCLILPLPYQNLWVAHHQHLQGQGFYVFIETISYTTHPKKNKRSSVKTGLRKQSSDLVMPNCFKSSDLIKDRKSVKLSLYVPISRLLYECLSLFLHLCKRGVTIGPLGLTEWLCDTCSSLQTSQSDRIWIIYDTPGASRNLYPISKENSFRKQV